VLRILPVIASTFALAFATLPASAQGIVPPQGLQGCAVQADGGQLIVAYVATQTSQGAANAKSFCSNMIKSGSGWSSASNIPQTKTGYTAVCSTTANVTDALVVWAPNNNLSDAETACQGLEAEGLPVIS
jgi:hypothetical protein